MAEKILFVDDEPSVLEGYQRLLRQDFKIETAVGGKEALEEAAEQVRSILAKDAKTRLPSTHGGVYTGKAIWIGPEHVVQRISSSAAIAHPKNLLSATPEVGDIVRIEYDHGQGIVEAINS